MDFLLHKPCGFYLLKLIIPREKLKLFNNSFLKGYLPNQTIFLVGLLSSTWVEESGQECGGRVDGKKGFLKDTKHWFFGLKLELHWWMVGCSDITGILASFFVKIKTTYKTRDCHTWLFELGRVWWVGVYFMLQLIRRDGVLTLQSWHVHRTWSLLCVKEFFSDLVARVNLVPL